MNLVTDSEGRLKLGKLEDVTSVQIESNEMELLVGWDVPSYHTNSFVHSKMPKDLNLLKGESVQLPIILREGETQL